MRNSNSRLAQFQCLFNMEIELFITGSVLEGEARRSKAKRGEARRSEVKQGEARRSKAKLGSHSGLGEGVSGTGMTLI